MEGNIIAVEVPSTSATTGIENQEVKPLYCCPDILFKLIWTEASEQVFLPNCSFSSTVF